MCRNRLPGYSLHEVEQALALFWLSWKRHMFCMSPLYYVTDELAWWQKDLAEASSCFGVVTAFGLHMVLQNWRHIKTLLCYENIRNLCIIKFTFCEVIVRSRTYFFQESFKLSDYLKPFDNFGCYLQYTALTQLSSGFCCI